MPTTSAKLHRARAAKNDEFYTQYDDVKKECDNYLSHFFNKIIYCNCDTADSAFVKYFTELKAAGKIRDVWFSGGLGGDDFRCLASLERLKAADIVVTNPPFSLFGEFIDQLMQYNKKFLIIGNLNAISHKYMSDFIRDNKLWLGTRKLGAIYFITPGGETAGIPAGWYTNLAHNHHRKLVCVKKYAGNESQYPKYDNADAINVNRVKDIPADYYGIMGVPITFADRYDPNEFVWLGADYEFTKNGLRGYINNKCLYARVFIKRKI
ncbi:MAG: adenine-specific methyltransferase EcoRI family protein [Alphaproteobacteria bacterium]|nr:adenine-specific methyltransferase EcoRI family protein [Alphaproteobacteria bacterium]